MVKLIQILSMLYICGCGGMKYQPLLLSEQQVTEYPPIIQAIIQVESSGNPKALSKKGAIGLMQVMPSTGRSMGYSKADLWNPKTNVEAGTKYFNKLMSDHCNNDVHCSLRSYVCGPGKRNGKACYKYADKVLRHVRNDSTYSMKKSKRPSKIESNELIVERKRIGYSFALNN